MSIYKIATSLSVVFFLASCSGRTKTTDFEATPTINSKFLKSVKIEKAVSSHQWHNSHQQYPADCIDERPDDAQRQPALGHRRSRKRTPASHADDCLDGFDGIASGRAVVRHGLGSAKAAGNYDCRRNIDLYGAVVYRITSGLLLCVPAG